LADKYYIVPPGDSPNYIKIIKKIVKKEKIDVILPLTTNELLPLSKHKDEIEKLNTKVLVSEYDNLIVAINKAKTYKVLSSKKIPTPKFRLVHSLKDLIKAIKNLGYPNNPVCIKPPISHGSIGLRIINPKINRFELYFKYKPDNIFTTYEEILSIFKEVKKFPELIVMEYLPGDEYSVDILAYKGKSLVIVPRSRLTTRAGITDIGIVVFNKELIKVSERIIKTLNLSYNINIQFKYSSENKPMIIEINPRVSGTIVACTGAGVNLPYLAIKLALGEKFEIPKIKYGTKIYRFLDEVFLNHKNKPFRVNV
ncbi:MAG: ATP-grasp domain-containing protein, partial [Candidatus Aenigmatarchaeota archaeon]